MRGGRIYRGHLYPGAWYVIRRAIKSISDAPDSPAEDLPSSAETSSAASYTLHQHNTRPYGIGIPHHQVAFSYFVEVRSRVVEI